MLSGDGSVLSRTTCHRSGALDRSSLWCQYLEGQILADPVRSVVCTTVEKLAKTARCEAQCRVYDARDMQCKWSTTEDFETMPLLLSYTAGMPQPHTEGKYVTLRPEIGWTEDTVT
jgi:hypothetical protein